MQRTMFNQTFSAPKTFFLNETKLLETHNAISRERGDTLVNTLFGRVVCSQDGTVVTLGPCSLGTRESELLEKETKHNWCQP